MRTHSLFLYNKTRTSSPQTPPPSYNIIVCKTITPSVLVREECAWRGVGHWAVPGQSDYDIKHPIACNRVHTIDIFVFLSVSIAAAWSFIAFLATNDHFLGWCHDPDPSCSHIYMN
jgi:hypothetical protein